MTVPLAAALLLLGNPQSTPSAIHWERDFASAEAKARAEGKPIFVDFWAPWCGWCHRLDETTYLDPEVVRLSRDFVPVKVNTEGGRAETLIALKYGVAQLPTMAFLSPSGRPILLVTGFQGPGTFPRVLVSAREAWAQVSTWEASLEQNPDDAEALVKLGAYLFEQEAYEDSRDLLARATAKDAKRPVEDRKEARMMLAIIRHYERRYADAEALLKEALGLEPPGAYDAQMLYVLGRTYKAWGRLDQARPVLERVVRTYPESPFAQRAQETLVALGRSR